MALLTSCYPPWLLSPIVFMSLPLDLSAVAYEPILCLRISLSFWSQWYLLPIRLMLMLDECSLDLFSSDSFCSLEDYVGALFHSFIGLGVPPPLGDRWFLILMSRWGFRRTSRGWRLLPSFNIICCRFCLYCSCSLVEPWYHSLNGHVY